MSDKDTKDEIASIDRLARSLRDSAGEDAQARWKADEERRAKNVEAHTAYLEAARANEVTRHEREDTRHADFRRWNDANVSANERVAAAAEAQTSVFERIAAALESLARGQDKISVDNVNAKQ